MARNAKTNDTQASTDATNDPQVTTPETPAEPKDSSLDQYRRELPVGLVMYQF